MTTKAKRIEQIRLAIRNLTDALSVLKDEEAPAADRAPYEANLKAEQDKLARFLKPKNPCECADPFCPVHKGKSSCDKAASTRMKRADMDDRTGVKFCRGCAADAGESGVFGPAQPLHWKV